MFSGENIVSTMCQESTEFKNHMQPPTANHRMTNIPNAGLDNHARNLYLPIWFFTVW